MFQLTTTLTIGISSGIWTKTCFSVQKVGCPTNLAWTNYNHANSCFLAIRKKNIVSIAFLSPKSLYKSNDLYQRTPKTRPHCTGHWLLSVSSKVAWACVMAVSNGTAHSLWQSLGVWMDFELGTSPLQHQILSRFLQTLLICFTDKTHMAEIYLYTYLSSLIGNLLL